MSKWIKTLTALLVVQLVLVAWQFGRGSDMGTFSSDEAILALKLEEFESLKIVQEGEPELLISKKDGKWVVPAAQDFPVDSAKIEGLLEKLLGLKKSWPVAKTQVAAKQLKVGKDDFERKVTFLKGDHEVATVFLGTAPAFRKVHLRVDGQDQVFAVEFSSFDLDPKQVSWFDRGLLRVARSEVESVALNGVVLKNTESGAQIEGLEPDEEVVKKEADTVLSAVSTLSFDEFVGVEEKPEYKELPLLLELKVRVKGGEEVSYVFSGPIEKEERYLLKSSKYPYFFKASKTPADTLKAATREKLVQKKAPEKPAKEEAKTEDQEAEGKEAVASEETEAQEPQTLPSEVAAEQ
ncbi:MAG: DUF4340 domain-containing protein [Deltaproteobacteria bacterium]|nr:DUF4340 domain-containing protein [Deltaproteobacteria bacterium]